MSIARWIETLGLHQRRAGGSLTALPEKKKVSFTQNRASCSALFCRRSHPAWASSEDQKHWPAVISSAWACRSSRRTMYARESADIDPKDATARGAGERRAKTPSVDCASVPE